MDVLKKEKVKFLKDYTYKTGGGKEMTIKKGTKKELMKCVITRLTSNPENIIVERV